MIDHPGTLARAGGLVPCRGRGGLVCPGPLSRRAVLGLLAGAALAGAGGVTDTAAASRKGRKIVQEARKHVGDNYVAGGTKPGGFDCSGFTYYVVKKAIGRDISPDLQAQTRVGRRVGKSRRRRGDLIFFNLEGGKRVTHVAIVISKTRVIHAMNPRDGVKISNMSSPYYMNNIRFVRRL